MNGGPDRAGIDAADLFVAFAEASVGSAMDEMAAARHALATRVGADAMVDAAAVAALFNAINRVADAIGIKVEASKTERTAYFRTALGLDAFQTARMS